MTEERALAVLRAAERLGLIALNWMPYTDECPEHLLSELSRAQRQIDGDLAFIRAVRKETEDAILNVAEHAGSKH